MVGLEIENREPVESVKETKEIQFIIESVWWLPKDSRSDLPFDNMDFV